MIGTTLGPYRILEKLGEGGMGEVFKARDTRLGRLVAIKVLPAGLAADPDPSTGSPQAGSGSSRAKSRDDRRRRFEQEARAVAALSHPHICVLHDIGSQDGVDFLVMEYLEGETLSERLRRTGGASGGAEAPPLRLSPLPLKEALEIGAQVADALGAAHRRGIVHRDLKPANIMLTPTGGARHGSPHVKLLDFGLAKLRPEASEAAGGASAATTEAPLTGDHQLLGTVPYMAPEQLEGKPVDARSDVFALGCVLYEMLTGRRAFEGTSSATVMAAILTSEPPPVSTLRPVTPPLLDRLVQTCLAKRPDDRWDSAHDVAEQLRAISDTRDSRATSASGQSGPIVAPRRGWWTRRRAGLAGAAALVVIVAAAVGGVLWARRAPAPAKPPTADITPAAPKLDPNRVVVALFENRTGDPDVDNVAIMTTEMLTRGLSQSGELAVSQNPAVATGGRPPEKPSSGPTSADALHALAKLLAEDWDGARALYEPLANLARPERPPGWSEPAAFALAVRFRGRLGVIAARRGDRAGAERIAEELRQIDRPYLYGESLYSRAMIAAALGDKPAAVQLLREAIAQGLGIGVEWEGYAVLLHRAPEMAPLRGYPPFEELIKPKG